MNAAFYKYCVVPLCKSTTRKTPDKLFIHVPNSSKVRIKWLKLASRADFDSLSSKSRMYFCEDHFDLPNDMENYMQYSIMGSVRQIRMKPDCLPSKFECQASVAKRTVSTEEPPPETSKRKRTGSEYKSSPHENENDEDFSKTEDEMNCLHEEISLPLSPSAIKQESEDEDAQMEHKIEDYETTIFKIKEEMAELRSENQRLMNENQHLAEENRRLKDKNYNLTSGIDQLLQKSEDQLTNYEQGNNIVTYTKERALLKNTIHYLNNEIKKHTANILEITEQNQQLLDRVKNFQQKVQQLKENCKCKEKPQNLPEFKQEIQDHNQKNAELVNTIQDLNKKLQDANHNVEELKFKNKNLMEKIEGCHGRKSANFKELAKIRSLTEENQALVEQVSELTDELSVVNEQNRKRMKPRRNF